MRDGASLRLIKRVTRWLATFDLLVTRAVLRRRGQQRYALTGTCNGCGKCCESPSLPVSRWIWYVPTLRALFLWWQRRVNGFELEAADPRFRIFVFRCSHFDRATRQCDSYDSRPLMCRDYPQNLTFDALPALFPECSYTILDKQADQLRAALRAAGLEGEKLAEVARQLYLSKKD